MKKIKVCAATPNIKVADPKANAKEIIRISKNAGKKGAKLVVFPELSLTGCTCGDLFLQDSLLMSSMDNLNVIAEKTKDVKAAIVFGMPALIDDNLYNIAVVLFKGKVFGIIPKNKLKWNAYGDEVRWFCTGFEGIAKKIAHFPEGLKNRSGRIIEKYDDLMDVDIDCNLKIDLKRQLGFTLGVGIGNNGSGRYFGCAYEGEEVDIVAHLGARRKVVDEYTEDFVKNVAYDSNAPVVYAESGDGESTTDFVFAGESEIASEYETLKKSTSFKNQVIYADIDIDEKKEVMVRNCYGTTIPKSEESPEKHEREQIFFLDESDYFANRPRLPYQMTTNPFIPEEEPEQKQMYKTILKIQAKALVKRMKTIGTDKLVLGISGGLDSTLALIACVNACDELKLNHKNIIAITMPGFGTTSRTHDNASKMMRFFGVTKKEISISDSVRQHFSDIKHGIRNKNSTYENAQARMRTMILMDVANDEGALMVGTGDFSELALGWATYNGDHMSMYSVNGNVPKTVIREVVSYVADTMKNERLGNILRDIVDTPVSPELLPGKNDKIAQKTEDLVGPYELHDYFLYMLMYHGYDAKTIYETACFDFKGKYDKKTIKKWLQVFIKRFFSQQFKRNCMPDGPAVFSFGLSPRGGFIMPSDASAQAWLDSIK